MSEILQIKNFKGTNFEYGQWAEGYGNYVMGIDVFGLQDNPSRLSKPGIMQCMRTMTAGTEAAAPNDVTDLIRHFVYWPGGNASVWGLSGEASPRLYERTTGTWTLRRSTAASDLLTASGGGGLASFAGSLWTAQNARVSRWDGTTWTQQFGTANLSSTASTPRPMKVFESVLCIGNGRYIDSINSTPTLGRAVASPQAANTLILPADFTITSMEVYRDRLFISAENSSNGAATPTASRVFVWDGISTTFETAFDMYDESSAPYLIFNQGVLWAIAKRGISTPGTPLYVFNGSAFDKIMMLPVGVGGASDIVTTYRGGILFGSTNSGSGSIVTNYPDTTNGVAGVWMVNRHTVNHPYQAILAFNPSNGTTQTKIGGIYASGQTVYVGTQNNSSSEFEVWEATGTDTNTAGLWDSQPIDAGDASRNKMWHAIQVDVESVGASNNLVLSYRTNYATAAYTTLKTISSNAVANNIMPIGVMGKVIQLRAQLGSATGTISSRLHGITLYYTVLN